MIKKFAEFINEDFTDLYKRWKGKETRKEDSLEVKMKEFISSRENTEEYYIENGLVCCKGDVRITDKDLVDGKFPVPFGKVDGYFDCSWCNELTSLEGTPEKVGGDFFCYRCDKLTSLEGASEKVGGDFSCSYDSISTLEGSPKEVGGDFICSFCEKLISLEGAPKEVGGDFYCHRYGKKFSESDLPLGTIIKRKFFNRL